MSAAGAPVLLRGAFCCPLPMRGGLVVPDPVSKKAARTMTTAASKPMADKKITALAGSGVAGFAPRLSGRRVSVPFSIGESRHK